MQGAVAGLSLLLLAVAAAPLQPGPGKCRHPQCTEFGNCGDHGECRCPFGRLGEGCEIDFLAPCRQFPDTLPYCGTSATKSCECMQRCRDYFCRRDSSGNEACSGFGARPDRGCYERAGVPPDEQYSRIPEEGEAGVTYRAWLSGQKITRQQALLEFGDCGIESLPLSLCPNECSRQGYCSRFSDDPNARPFCRCHRGYGGHDCAAAENRCYLQCNGRGTCLDQFCHCTPPYFSVGCSRSRVYPPAFSAPSPTAFKIYMYDLPTQLAYDQELFTGWQQHDEIYTAYQHFLSQFLLSTVRTEDPSEAHLFYIPMLHYSHSSNTGVMVEHVHSVLDHIRSRFPYWNRTGGKDHFYWASGDRGACYHADALAREAIHITHFGLYSSHNSVGWAYPFYSDEYGCHNPMRDIVAPPYELRAEEWVPHSRQLTLDSLIAHKKELFFFSGGVRFNDPEYGGNTRLILHNLAQQWNDTEFGFVADYVGGEYEDRLRQAKFCLAPYGHGFGMRLVQAALAGCVPVIVQEHVVQAFEDVLPYETFSVRLSNDDLPRIREILRGVTPEQYRGMLHALGAHRGAFFWQPDMGGKAFDYTIASLRRRYLNLKAEHF